MQFDPSNTKNIIGATAFVLSTATLMLGFPLLAKIRIGNRADKVFLIMFFVGGLIARLVWLKYLWVLNDFFVRSIYGLEALSSGVLLIHIVIAIKNKSP